MHNFFTWTLGSGELKRARSAIFIFFWVGAVEISSFIIICINWFSVNHLYTAFFSNMQSESFLFFKSLRISTNGYKHIIRPLPVLNLFGVTSLMIYSLKYFFGDSWEHMKIASFVKKTQFTAAFFFLFFFLNIFQIHQLGNIC